MLLSETCSGKAQNNADVKQLQEVKRTILTNNELNGNHKNQDREMIKQCLMQDAMLPFA